MASLRGDSLSALRRMAADETVPTDPHTLAGIIYQTYVATFDATLADEAERAGSPIHAKLTNPDVLEELAARAEETADGILATYQHDFELFLGSLPAGISDQDAARAIVRWTSERDVWKSTQIALTETSRARGLAQAAFAERSGAKGKAYFGGSATCKLCQAIAAENPYDLDDPDAFVIPHPSCGDSWEVRYHSIDEPWRGD